MIMHGVHYSGQDINIFAYRNLLDIIDKEDDKARNVSSYQNKSTGNDNWYNVGGLEPSLKGSKYAPMGAKNEIEDRAQPKTDGSNVSGPNGRASAGTSAQTGNSGEEKISGTANGNYSPYIHIGSLSELSYSSFREKFAVRTLGRTHAKAYTRGPRTVAGTMTFNTIQENELLHFAKQLDDIEGIKIDAQNVMMDQIDPFHLIVVFGNEYGAFSVMYLFNVEFGSESQRMSVNDLVLQQNVNFYATDILPMEDAGTMFKSYDQMISGNFDIPENVKKGTVPVFNVKNKLDSFGANPRLDALLQRSRGLY
jgi:hypothetical protein